MSDQVELNFEAISPRTTAGEVAEMEQILARKGEWMKAKDFPAPWTERSLRGAASESGGRIISGQRGYKLTRAATPEESDRATKWLRHQAQTMNRRAIEIDLAREAMVVQ